MSRKLLLLVSVSLAAAAWPVAEAAEEIAPAELAIMAAAFALILALQCGALLLAGRFANDKLVGILAALLIAANAYHFALLTTEANTLTRLLFAALTGAGAWLLMHVAVAGALSFLFALVFTALSLGQYAHGRARLAEEMQDASFAPLSLPVKSDRNVYLISMESLHSPGALRDLYGIDAPAHVAYLKAEGFRVLDRAYSIGTTTRAVFQRIMEFSKPLTQREETRRVFRSGNSTFRSFRDSGYRIQFIYINNYMNMNPKLLDHHFPEAGFYVCDNVPISFFYFICRSRPRAFINTYLFGLSDTITASDQIAHLKERIGVIRADDKPWLTICHLAFPEHTKKSYRYDDPAQVERFRELYRSFMPQVAENYRQIVTAIKEKDPDAVIVTFGDHGTWLTRGLKVGTSDAGFDADDYVQDRYGVMLAVYPQEFCRNRIFEGSATSFMIKSVIACLNGNDDPTPEDLEQNRSIFYADKFVPPETLSRPN